MPTFFEGLRRLLIGEPVFKPGDDADTPISHYPDEQQPTQKSSIVHDGGEKEHPVAVIDHLECHVKNDYMEIHAFIKNNSSGILWIDRMLLFGNKYEINHDLDPGEKREFPVYHGPLLDNKFYTHCELHYRTVEGDYFSSMHAIDFEEEADNHFVPHRIRFYPPVKDI